KHIPALCPSGRNGPVHGRSQSREFVDHDLGWQAGWIAPTERCRSGSRRFVMQQSTRVRCTECGRTIEACACCDAVDCPPPICDRDLTEPLLRSMRSRYFHRGASLSEIEESSSASAGQ